MKRVIDIFLVITTFPLWIIPFTIVAILIWLTMGTPIFFHQERAGKNGLPFMFIKFRTMRLGNEPDYKRITLLGKFLRKTSLDELPQLFHVLSGKMSLVGPRPLPTKYLPRYSKEQARRHEVTPGITGWAQINGRNTISWKQKFEYDVWYVDNKSFLLDCKILWKTIFHAAKQNGINSSETETMPEFMGDTNQ